MCLCFSVAGDFEVLMWPEQLQPAHNHMILTCTSRCVCMLPYAVQGLLLLAHPAIVISWIAFGMWHGLMTSS